MDGGSPGQILKITLVFFCDLICVGGGWVGGKIRIFEKSAYVPSKKYLHPPELTLKFNFDVLQYYQYIITNKFPANNTIII